MSSAYDWLNSADADVLMAKVLLESKRFMLLAGAGFHTQQAAEKAVKALLVLEGVKPPRSHSIEELVDLLPPPHHLREPALRLSPTTTWESDHRYPGVTGDPGGPPPDDVERLLDEIMRFEEVVAALLPRPKGFPVVDLQRSFPPGPGRRDTAYVAADAATLSGALGGPTHAPGRAAALRSLLPAARVREMVSRAGTTKPSGRILSGTKAAEHILQRAKASASGQPRLLPIRALKAEMLASRKGGLIAGFQELVEDTRQAALMLRRARSTHEKEDDDGLNLPWSSSP